MKGTSMPEEYNPIEGLSIIGESINDTIPSTKAMFDNGDIQGIVNLAKFQAEAGAAYLDVNIGKRDPKLIGEVVRAIQKEVAIPLSIDSPDHEIQKEGLSAYNPERGGSMPVVNSISELRLEILELNSITPFKPIMLCTERVEDGAGQPNKKPEEVHQTARRMVDRARQAPHQMENDRIILDLGIAPIGADMDGLTKCMLDAMKLVHEDADLKGVHISGGLSNFTQMLPSKRANGGLVKTPLESALLTLAMPLGMDMCIGSMKKKYRILSDDNDALVALKEAVAAGGMETIMRIQQFYS
jgi:5-methyltetrahydrofolate--homocysteine methyltransferase